MIPDYSPDTEDSTTAPFEEERFDPDLSLRERTLMETEGITLYHAVFPVERNIPAVLDVVFTDGNWATNNRSSQPSFESTSVIMG